MPKSRTIIRGKHTRVDLSRVQECLLPWQEDAWGQQRPPFVPSLARLCAELSANLYDLDIGRWMEAGWGDGSFQMEEQIVSGFTGWQGQKYDAGKAIKSQFALRRARNKMNAARPFNDILRTVQQFVTTSTGKVLVMVYPLKPPERFVIAVSFMGTSRKFYDWITNFKITCTENGLHEGFQEISRQFEHNAGNIHFPEVALTLGLPDLTLADVIQEMRTPESRFTMLVSGHSQGGAVAQCYIHRLMHEYAVRPLHLVCYTLAAPTVVSEHWQGIPAAYPIFNIINSDDYVSRVGSCIRLGIDMVYHPDDAFRQDSYSYNPKDPAQVYAVGRLKRILQYIEDTPTAFEAIIALCEMLQEEGDATLKVLTSLNAAFKYLPPAMNTLGLSQSDINRLLSNRFIGLYRDAYEHPPEVETLNSLAHELQVCMHELGAETFTQTLIHLLFMPHIINSDPKQGESPLPSYIAIVRRHMDELQCGHWVVGNPCHVQTPTGDRLLPLPRLAPLTINPPEHKKLPASTVTETPEAVKEGEEP